MAGKKKEIIKETTLPQPQNVNGVETGIVALDLVLGGYLPFGKIIELNSESSVGKTTLALYLASRLCMQGKKVYYVDIERGVDEGILHNMHLLEHLAMVLKDKSETPTFGNKNFILDQRASLFSEFQGAVDWCLGKDAKDRTKKPIRHQDTPDLIVLDSLAMLVPDGAKEKDIESNVSNNMIASRYTTQMFKDVVGDITETGTTLLFINHTQTKMRKIGFTMQQAYQDSAGSSMVKYGTDVRLYIDRSKELTRVRTTLTGTQETRVGSTAEIYTKKSRLADNGVRVPIKLIDAFGVFNGYTLKMICENLKWIEGSGGHNYVKEPLLSNFKDNSNYTVNEKGLYLCGSDNTEIFCQQNAGVIIKTLKEQNLYHLTLDRAEHETMIDVITKTGASTRK